LRKPMFPPLHDEMLTLQERCDFLIFSFRMYIKR
jgi:hypothetical protein